MKARLNLTIDESLLSRVKSHSENDIIDLVENLNPPKLDVEADLKKDYYEDQAGKTSIAESINGCAGHRY